MNETLTSPDPRLLADLVRRIREVIEPLRIILFGSAARGQMGPNSDLDVLVIVPDGTDIAATEKAIYLNMWGFGFAADIIAVTDRHVSKHKDNPYLVIQPALSEGKDLYSAVG